MIRGISWGPSSSSKLLTNKYLWWVKQGKKTERWKNRQRNNNSRLNRSDYISYKQGNLPIEIFTRLYSSIKFLIQVQWSSETSLKLGKYKEIQIFWSFFSKKLFSLLTIPESLTLQISEKLWLFSFLEFCLEFHRRPLCQAGFLNLFLQNNFRIFDYL